MNKSFTIVDVKSSYPQIYGIFHIGDLMAYFYDKRMAEVTCDFLNEKFGDNIPVSANTFLNDSYN